MLAIALLMVTVADSKDPCLTFMRGDKSATNACVEFEIARLSIADESPSAIQNLSGLGADAIPLLKNALNSTKETVRAGASDALGRIAVRSDATRQQEIFRALVKWKADPSVAVRTRVAGAAARVSANLPERSEILAAARNDTDESVRRVVAGVKQ